MDCGISEPYLIIEIFISDDSYHIVWKNKTNIFNKRCCKRNMKFTDMPDIKPVSDKILIEFQSKKYNPSVEPLLKNLSKWLSTCIVDKLKIISIHDNEFLVRFLEIFSFFKMNKLHLKYWGEQLNDQPMQHESASREVSSHGQTEVQQNEYIESFFQQFGEKYPNIELVYR